MTQQHAQFGMFHITTNAKNKVPWCTAPGIPNLLLDNLHMTRNMHGASLHAFCILPNHMHILLCPGSKGLSAFMHSFKRNTMRDIRQYYPPDSVAEVTNLRCSNLLQWQKGFYDERIRSGRQCSACIGYIQGNAMRHKLVNDFYGWPWSSLHFEHLLDPMEPWLD